MNSSEKEPDIHGAPMRFGILCTGMVFPAWQARCIEALTFLDTVAPALLILEEPSLSSPSISPRKNSVWTLYRSIWLRRRSRALHSVDMSALLQDVPSINCRAVRKDDVFFTFPEETVSEIRKYELDFILHFGNVPVCGDILTAASFGVWSFAHDARERRTGCPPAFKEVIEKGNVIETSLDRLYNENSTSALKKGCFKILPFSYIASIDSVYLESARWPAQVCVDIRNRCAKYLTAHAHPTAPVKSIFPNNVSTLRFLFTMFFQLIVKVAVTLCRQQQWNVGIIYEPIDCFLRTDARPEVHWLPPPKRHRYRADPFGVAQEKQLTILYEDFDYRPFKAKISSVEISGPMHPYRFTTALELPLHLSYPYLIEYEGGMYCIPETSRMREVSLYKALHFPDRWEKFKVLIDNFAGVDATIFHYQDRWWLMCGDQDHDQNLNLFVWYAPDLFGLWQPHAANPVKTDVRSSRPAGTPFIHKETLYRPAQNLAVTYGGQIVFNRIKKLTPIEYEEEPIAAIEPFKDSPYPDGVHTIASVGNITLIDGKRLRFFGSGFIHALFSNITRRLAG